MKKIYIILFLAFGLQTYAQKTVFIFNYSSTNIDIGEIGTRHYTTTYPVFISNPSGGMITIASGDTYKLEATPASTTKFPFYSPGSSPVIDYWIRTSAPGVPTANLPSNLVATLYGATQILDHFKFQIGPRGSLGGTTFFPTLLNGYFELYTFGSTGSVSLDVIDAVSGYPAADGETYIIIFD